ncbi:hypothetical protein G6F57_023131 [Rhizopus arrhizus]|nr:hypothetical protein G6F57_023131 [Rhizopus arrhizus]
MDAHAAFRHGADELGCQLIRPVAVHQQIHADDAPGGGDQRLLQFLSDLVLEQDEGLDQHLVLSRLDARRTAGK